MDNKPLNPKKVNYGFVRDRRLIVGHDRAPLDARNIIYLFDSSDDVEGDLVALLRDIYYEIQQQTMAEIRTD